MLGTGADHAAFRLIATGAEGVRLHQQAISVPDEMMSTEGDTNEEVVHTVEEVPQAMIGVTTVNSINHHHHHQAGHAMCRRRSKSS